MDNNIFENGGLYFSYIKKASLDRDPFGLMIFKAIQLQKEDTNKYKNPLEI